MAGKKSTEKQPPAPDEASGHHERGLDLHGQGRFAEAEAAFRRALEIRPDYPEALNNLGAILRATGRAAEAETVCRRALALRPDYLEAYYNLAIAHRFEPGDPLIGELSRLLARQPRKGRERHHLLVALGKAHDEIGEYGKAFGYYRKVNEERAREARYDPAGQRNWVAAIKAAFPEPLLCPDRSPTPVTPVFVVGMSRSGKTLVESLLARHPAVTGAGESNGFRQALGRMLAERGISTPFPDCLPFLNPLDLRGIGTRYLDDLRRQLTLGTRFHVNTLPGNYSHIGLIFRAFPSVKVIYCRREPLDHCLQIYFKFFVNGHEYSYDFDHLASYYLGYREMMDHWLGFYDEHILTVDYEDLVRDPQESGRKVYAYCGLKPPPEGFGTDFHSGQVGHARHYEAELAPLRKALGR